MKTAAKAILIGCLLATLASSGCTSTTTQTGHVPTASSPSSARHGKIELLRDRWGVPHVFSNSDAGAMYGLGYATAQDRAFQMYYNLRIIQGRLAQLIGNVKVGANRRQPEGRNSAFRNDIKMRTVGYYRAAEKLQRNLDRRTLDLLEAYSQGVNDYINSHPNDLLYLFKELDLDPEPWTPAACIASWWRLGLFFAGDGLRDMQLYYQILQGRTPIRTFDPNDQADTSNWPRIRDDASVIQRDDVTEKWISRVYQYAKAHDLKHRIVVTPMRGRPAGPRFSHAWVVGAKKTTTGSAILISDPQTPVRNPSLFYEFHIAGRTFNARGIGVAGSPLILIGFSQNLAWGMTALGADQADLFVLKTDPNHPDQYHFDGNWLEMSTRTERITVKGGRAHNLTIKETHLGPVVTSLVTGTRPGDEVALKLIPVCRSDQETVQAALPMMRAADVNEFRKALYGWHFPSANCLFGDRKGNIGYMTVLALPVRSRKALLDGTAAHDGSSSENDWQDILPPELLPQVINPAQGWLASANHRPIASFYPIPLGISTGSLGDTDRSWRLKERLSMKESFSPQDVLDTHYDTVSPIKRDIVRLGYHLRDTLKSPLEQDTLKALQYLEPWHAKGCKSEMSIPGTEVVNIMPLIFRRNFAAATIYGGGLSGLCNMLQTIKTRLEADPSAPLTQEETEYINLTLRDAWRYAKAQYKDDPNQWNRLAIEQLQRSKMPYFETLDGFASLDENSDITVPPLNCIEAGTILSQRAQSYTQYVLLNDIDSSMSLLPPGSSEHPGSPYHLSGYELWSKGLLRPAPLSQDKVRTFAVSRRILEPSAHTVGTSAPNLSAPN